MVQFLSFVPHKWLEQLCIILLYHTPHCSGDDAMHTSTLRNSSPVLSWRHSFLIPCHIETPVAVEHYNRSYASQHLTLAPTILVYRSMIRGRLSYASSAFYHYYQSFAIGNMEPLTQLTKCAMTGFFGLPPWSRTSPLFQQLRLTTLEDIIYFIPSSSFFVVCCLFS